MSGSFASDNAPQPPKILRSSGEIAACLRPAQQQHLPLRITFARQDRQFQSFIVEIDEGRNLIALDDLIPRDGERLIEQGLVFRVESFNEGVRVSWQIDQPVQVGELEGTRCYWVNFPAELTYHQRRNAFRVKLLLNRPAAAELVQANSPVQLRGQLIDISATGCKLRFSGNVSYLLQPGQLVQNFIAELPIGAINTSVNIRHVTFQDRLDQSDVGVCFHNLNGAVQRQIERFIYQLQRENRRHD